MSTLHRLMLDRYESYDATSPSQNRASPNSTETDLDTNMVIILAALLCALICALGLNTLVRCALRCCSRRIAFDETTSCLASKGLKKSALRKIPVGAYGAGIKILATECPICLGEFVDGEKVRVLPSCNHGYHVRCIDTWLASHSSCPTCRLSLLETMPKKPTGAGVPEAVSGGRRQGEVAAVAV